MCYLLVVITKQMIRILTLPILLSVLQKKKKNRPYSPLLFCLNHIYRKKKSKFKIKKEHNWIDATLLH